MKVYLETRLTPEITVYDTENKPAGSGIDWKKLFSPAVTITDDMGNVLFNYGTRSDNLFPLVAIGCVLALIGAIYLIRKI